MVKLHYAKCHAPLRGEEIVYSVFKYRETDGEMVISAG